MYLWKAAGTTFVKGYVSKDFQIVSKQEHQADLYWSEQRTLHLFVTAFVRVCVCVFLWDSHSRDIPKLHDLKPYNVWHPQNT